MLIASLAAFAAYRAEITCLTTGFASYPGTAIEKGGPAIIVKRCASESSTTHL